MKKTGKLTSCITAIALLLSSCVTVGGGGRSSAIGPQLSSLLGQEVEAPDDPDRPRIDIVIPVFDPGIEAGDEEQYAKVARNKWQDENKAPVTADEYVWPELRRAEAVRFAYKLKEALENTGEFGAVRVTPDSQATGDLYILGRIEESDGEDVEIDLQVVDISGNKWLEKSFDHSVEEEYHKNLRNKGKDPYDPMFEEAAEYLVEELKYYETAELHQTLHKRNLAWNSNCKIEQRSYQKENMRVSKPDFLFLFPINEK